MTSSDFNNSVIALACWQAAKSELHQAMISVCMVFKNRAEAEGLSVYEVASKYLIEFPILEFPDTRDPQFQQLLVKLDNIVSGLVPDKTGGALWFVPKTQLRSGSLQGFTTTATIGGLVFVR
jgi:hypothetical protein